MINERVCVTQYLSDTFYFSLKLGDQTFIFAFDVQGFDV